MNETLAWLLPAAGGVLGVTFFAGVSYALILNSRRAISRMFKRLEAAEATIATHDFVMIRMGWKTNPGVSIRDLDEEKTKP